MNKEEKRYETEIASFGQRIKQIRETKELTQLDLELSSGIDRTEISRIENGARNIEFFTMVKFLQMQLLTF